MFLVIVWRVFAYQVLPQCATTAPWAAAWAPGISGCQHTQPAQKKVMGGAQGPTGCNPMKIGSFSSAAKFHYSLLWCGIEAAPIFDVFWPFLLVRTVSAKKNGDFLAAQPPERSFDRPVRWHLRYLRARDVQHATLSLVCVTCGGSNLPVHPKKRPRAPKLHTQNGRFPAQQARLWGLRCSTRTYEWAPIERFFESTKIPSRTATSPGKKQICIKNKK